MTFGDDCCVALRAELKALGITSLGHLKEPAATLKRIIDAQYALQKPPKVKGATKTPEEWLSELKSSPAYAGLDVGLELAKAKVWCGKNSRRCTERFLINWLNRADRPIPTGGTAINVLPELPGWRFFMEEREAEGLHRGPIPSSWEEMTRTQREQVHGAKFQLKNIVEFASANPREWQERLAEIKRERQEAG